jgi:acetyl-CoA carboxylase biotin carboxyl carrier protein
MMKDQDSKQPRRSERSSTAKPEPSVNMDELRELIALLRDNGLSEFELEREGFRVRLRRGVDFASGETGAAPAGGGLAPATPPPGPAGSAGVVTGSAAAVVPGKGSAAEDQDLHIIPSPIVGTFYRSRSPNAEPFVTVGSHVDQDSVVCIIEAMKLMNEITAEATGVVAKIYVENGQPVEYGQPLFGLRN